MKKMENKNIKNLVRKEIREKRENLTQDEKEKLSLIIREKFLNLSEVKNAEIVMSYMDFKNEVETRKINEILMENGKKVLVPRVSENKEKIIPVEVTGEYRKGNFGIEEAKGKDFLNGKIDIVIVPGIAFNENGGRIGFGKGYYDKFFSEREKAEDKILKISLAYDFQIDNRFKEEKHDKNVDIIVTEKRIIKVSY